jgi:trigger factor
MEDNGKLVLNKEIERQENSAVKLTVTVGKDAAKNEYDSLIKKYCKSVRLKGFRKGKVPPSVLEQKFGESLRQEAALNLLDGSLKEAIDGLDEQPLPYEHPSLVDEEKIELDLENDFTYAVTYDVFPEFEVAEYKGLTIEEPVVTVGKEDIERELEQYREQNAVVADKTDDVVAEGNIVTVDYVELDENEEEIEGTERQDFTFTVGTGYNLYKFDENVTGMNLDETKIIDKEFPEDYEYSDYAGKKVKLRVTVTAVKERLLPDLDDELAQDISDSYETLDDLKKDIKERLSTTVEQRIREMKIESILDQVAEKTEITLPESMITAETESRWRNFLAQSRMTEEQIEQVLAGQDRSKEKMLEEWRPSIMESLKRQLIIGKMLDAEKIEVDDEEFEAELKKQSERSQSGIDEIREYVEKNNMREMIVSDIRRDKLFDTLFEESTIKKGKKMKYLDLANGNQ